MNLGMLFPIVNIRRVFKSIFLSLLFLFADKSFAEEFPDTLLRGLDIPLIMISTDDGVDPQGYRVEHPEGCIGIGLAGNEYKTGRMVMTLLDSTIYDSGEYMPGASGIRIKQRGNISATWNKKPYKLKLSKKYDLFKRGDKKYRSKDWILLSCPKVDINTLVGFKVSELLGMEWTPEIQYVNIVLNGDYKGLYLLCESVEKSEGRCDVSENGFIIEDDAYWWNENVYFKGELLPYYMGYTFKYPDADDVTEEYLSALKDYIIEVEEKLSKYEDISEYLDLKTFAMWLMGHDILGTEDAAGSNRYIYKNDFIPGNATSSILKMGPLWDFDDIYRREGKWSQQHDGNYRFYFKYLLNYQEFIDEYVVLWCDIKNTLYNDLMDYLHTFEQDYGETLDICRELDSKRWHRSRYNLIADDIRIVDEWMSSRLEWIDEQLMKETFVHVVKEEQSTSSVYTLDGRQVSSDSENSVSKLPTGIYIKDGRKFIIR
jgi:hypothetical protein